MKSNLDGRTQGQNLRQREGGTSMHKAKYL
jgi:hypothetical protein